MPEAPERKPQQEDQEYCLDFSLQAVASHLRANEGREVPFTRAVLLVHNACESDVIYLSLHATLGQEGGTVRDVTHALSGPASLPAGKEWWTGAVTTP